MPKTTKEIIDLRKSGMISYKEKLWFSMFDEVTKK